MTLKNVQLIKFQTVTDHRGSISIAESVKNIPFKIERTFHTYRVPEGANRGEHAHRQNEQVYACLNGKVTVTLDDGTDKDEVTLSNPGEGLYVGPLVWHSLKNFDHDTVFFVWNSRGYEEEDYIKNYD